jgi:hypothetical protein
MTDVQWQALLGWLGQRQPDALHHGGCRGADEQADAIARSVGAWIISHPGPHGGTGGDETRRPLPYLERNRAIVDETDVLVATPQTPDEQMRSGTWATIRYARSQGKPVTVIAPDGSVANLAP